MAALVRSEGHGTETPCVRLDVSEAKQFLW